MYFAAKFKDMENVQNYGHEDLSSIQENVFMTGIGHGQKQTLLVVKEFDTYFELRDEYYTKWYYIKPKMRCKEHIRGDYNVLTSIKPIKLTDGMFIYNGFKFYTDHRNPYDKHNSNESGYYRFRKHIYTPGDAIYVRIWKCDDSSYNFAAEFRQSTSTPSGYPNHSLSQHCLYVHELQNYYRLCGVELNFNLFDYDEKEYDNNLRYYLEAKNDDVKITDRFLLKNGFKKVVNNTGDFEIKIKRSGREDCIVVYKLRNGDYQIKHGTFGAEPNDCYEYCPHPVKYIREIKEFLWKRYKDLNIPGLPPVIFKS